MVYVPSKTVRLFFRGRTAKTAGHQMLKMIQAHDIPVVSLDMQRKDDCKWLERISRLFGQFCLPSV